VPSEVCTCGTSEETPDNVFWQCQRFTKERKNLTKGLLKRWNTLPLKVDMILTRMDPSDVYELGAFVNTIKIRMHKARELTPTTIGNQESPDQSTVVLDRIAI
jgi:hypothetical protein